MTVAADIATRFTALGAALTALRASLTAKTGTPHDTTPLADLPAAIDGISTGSGGWVRHPEWLTLPTLSDTDQRVVMVYEVRPTMTACSVTCAGAYQVDWGDGSAVQSVASGVNVQHTYVFADLPHSLADGNKQVLVSITPQSGQSLTSVNLTPAHADYSKSWVNGILDLAINAPALNALTLQSVFPGTSKAWRMQRFSLGKNSLISLVSLLASCVSLVTVPRLDTDLVTSCQYAFQKCYALLEGPAMNTAAVTNFSNMFASCSSLRSVPNYNTANGTDFSSMFSSCAALRRLPTINYGKATTLSSFVVNAYSLQAIPAINAPLATNVSSLASGCGALAEAGPLSFPAATNSATMFGTCAALERCLLSLPIATSLASCNLNRAALVELFGTLPTVTGSPALTITSNPGVGALSADDKAIATNKGWILVL